MTKPAATQEITGSLIRHYSAFHNNSIPIGTPCVVTSEGEETYTVKFPTVISYAGSFSIKKIYVKLDS
jgi:hypothetical protein